MNTTITTNGKSAQTCAQRQRNFTHAVRRDLGLRRYGIFLTAEELAYHEACHRKKYGRGWGVRERRAVAHPNAVPEANSPMSEQGTHPTAGTAEQLSLL